MRAEVEPLDVSAVQVVGCNGLAARRAHLCQTFEVEPGDLFGHVREKTRAKVRGDGQIGLSAQVYRRLDRSFLPHQKAHSPMTTPEGTKPPALLLHLPLLPGDMTLTDRYAPTRAPAAAGPVASVLR